MEEHIRLLREEAESLLADMAFELRAVLYQVLSGGGRVFSDHGGPEWGTLPLLTCGTCGGDWRKAAPAAAAVELWLAAGDVFDDLEDRDPGGLWQLHGDGVAANAGTALIFLSQLAVARLSQRFDDSIVLRVGAEMSRAGLRSCGGQHLDLCYESRLDITEADYFRMTEARSGSLMECACRVGAILANSGEAVIASYGAFGRYLGVAFQVENDVRSMLGEHGVKSDIARRKKTHPIIYGLGQAEGDEREFLCRFFGSSDPVTDETEDRVQKLLESLGSTKYSLTVADVHRQRAANVLRDIMTDGPPREKETSLVLERLVRGAVG